MKLFEKLNEQDRDIAAIVLKNTLGQNSVELNEGSYELNEAPTVSGDYSRQYIVPLIEYVQTELVSKELVDTQPINFREGKIFGLEIKDASGNVITGAGAVGTFDDSFSEVAEGDDMNELTITINESLVSAKTRKVKLEYTKELDQDLNVIGYDFDKRKNAILGTEIATAIDFDIIASIVAHSDHYTPIEYTWSNNGTESYVNPLRELSVAIFTAAGAIATATRKGLANFVIIPTLLQAVIAAAPGFVPIQEPKLSPLAKIGKLGYLDVYVNTFDTTTYDMYVGKRPTPGITGGVIYSPYKIEATGPVPNPETFDLNQALFARYAVGYVPGGNTFYHKVFMTGSPTNFPYAL